METQQVSQLKKSWEALRAEQPGIRIRNAAKLLGVSEAELIATRCGEGVVRLEGSFQEILSHIESLGRVMALSRNEEVVHERKGVYLSPGLDNPHVGLFVGEDIDLRIFFGPWGFTFAVEESAGNTVRKSLQFFAKDGEAIHKIYLIPGSDEAAFDRLVAKYKSEDQSSALEITVATEDKKEETPEPLDVEAFRTGWLELQDTHEFFGLLKKHKLNRIEALQNAPEGGYAVPIQTSVLRKMLDEVSARELEIMVFVGNKGIIQIHTGPAKKIVIHEHWLNVLDPAFNLHLSEPGIAEAWVVRKPTKDGIVTAIECFNHQGDQVAQWFGKRKPGIPELESWRLLVGELENEFRLVSPN